MHHWVNVLHFIQWRDKRWPGPSHLLLHNWGAFITRTNAGEGGREEGRAAVQRSVIREGGPPNEMTFVAQCCGIQSNGWREGEGDEKNREGGREGPPPAPPP